MRPSLLHLQVVMALALLNQACDGSSAPPPPACANTLCTNPHPTGWAVGGSAQFHGTQARLSTECVTCHDQQGAGLLCLACHRVGGSAGVSLHLPDFVATHSPSDVAGNELAPIGGGISVACLFCHMP